MEDNKAYVIIVDTCDCYDQSSNVDMVTTNKEEAEKRLSILREEVRNYAKENNFVFNDGETSIESYEVGFSLQNHYYVTMYEKDMV